MESILNPIANLFFWGSIATLAWGAALALGHALASRDARGSASGPRSDKPFTPGHAPHAAD